MFYVKKSTPSPNCKHFNMCNKKKKFNENYGEFDFRIYKVLVIFSFF